MKDFRIFRYGVLGVAFLAVCIFYITLLYNAQSSYVEYNDPNEGYTVSYETIYAVRGEIFDRNGVPLALNKYQYSLTMEYGAMPKTKKDINDLFLYADHVIKLYGLTENVPASQSPFKGMYPDITYDEEKLQSETISKNLAYMRRIYGIDKTDCESVVNKLIQYYGLLATDEQGNRIYTDDEVTLVLSMRYDCEAKKFGPDQPYVFCTDIGEDLVLEVRGQSLAGLSIAVNYKRYYPNDGIATHILGRLGKISPDNWEEYKALGYSIDANVGVSGCEKAFESYLRGVNGKRKIVRDENGIIVSNEIVEEPTKGNDVYLTIDFELQKTAQQALADTLKYVHDNAKPTQESQDGADASAASVVVMNPDTFEILAIASYPSYTMEEYEKNYKELEKDKSAPLFFRAVNGTYAPGSTFKVGMAVAALENGTITPSWSVDTTNSQYIKHGKYTYYSDYQPTCWYRNMYGRSHGVQNAQAAIKNSCNCFFFEVGRLLGIEKMNEYCTLYGLGQSTGIEIPENIGILAGPEYREEMNLNPWTGGDTIAAAIGQSDNLFSPLQLCSYVSMLMNGGTRYNAHLLSAVKAFGTDQIIAQTEQKVLSTVSVSDSTLSVIKKGMREVYTESSSNKKAFKGSSKLVLDNVMIKTGTAEVGGNRSHNATMIGYMETEEHGALTVSVVIEQGMSGSNAGVAVGKIMTEYFS